MKYWLLENNRHLVGTLIRHVKWNVQALLNKVLKVYRSFNQFKIVLYIPKNMSLRTWKSKGNTKLFAGFHIKKNKRKEENPTWIRLMVKEKFSRFECIPESFILLFSSFQYLSVYTLGELSILDWKLKNSYSQSAALTRSSVWDWQELIFGGGLIFSSRPTNRSVSRMTFCEVKRLMF